MDPKACLMLAWEHFAEGGKAEARRSLAEYRAWRRAGGFEPEMDGLPGDRYAEVLAYRIRNGGVVEIRERLDVPGTFKAIVTTNSGRSYWACYAGRPTESQVIDSWRTDRKAFQPYIA
jgi:hypothetical protein